MANPSIKSNLSPATLLIAIVAALGLTSPALRSGDKKSAESNPVSIAGERTRKSDERSAEDLILEFLDAAPQQFGTDRKWSAGDAPCSMAEPNCWQQGDPRYRYALRFLVAMIPEPDSPLLSYKFDAQLDAIQAAAATAGYVPDRFYLPWLKKKSTSDSNETSSEKFKSIEFHGSYDLKQSKITTPLGITITSAYKESEDEGGADKNPGLMLFRGSLRDDLLLLFLVGESPTRGVSKRALRSSLDQVAWLSGWRTGDKRYPDQPNAQIVGIVCDSVLERKLDPLDFELSLLGPAFSGSASSLKFTLDSWLESFASVRATSPCPASQRSRPVDAQADAYLRPRVTIISGSATGSGEAFQDDAQITYSTVRLPDTVTTPVLIKDLRSRLPQLTNQGWRWPFLQWQTPTQVDRRIALLVEDTGYGANLLPERSADPLDSHGVLYLSFPLHISDLRTAVDQGVSTEAQPQLNLGHRDLSLTADSGDDNVEDVPPSFSKRSAVYDELVLSKLLSTIVRERVRYVGIVATDIEDLIFLVHEIRVNCPDTTIFVTGSDLRYLHTDVNQDLTGTIVFSNYPLFSMSQQWVWPLSNKVKNFDTIGPLPLGDYSQMQFSDRHGGGRLQRDSSSSG